jgi:hypothetical protein
MFVTRWTTKVSCAAVAGVDTAYFFLFCGPVCLFDAPCTPSYDREAPLSFSASVLVGLIETKLAFVADWLLTFWRWMRPCSVMC